MGNVQQWTEEWRGKVGKQSGRREEGDRLVKSGEEESRREQIGVHLSPHQSNSSHGKSLKILR